MGSSTWARAVGVLLSKRAYGAERRAGPAAAAVGARRPVSSACPRRAWRGPAASSVERSAYVHVINPGAITRPAWTAPCRHNV
eukprot:7364253-Prymnesium_polylepis.1